MMKWIHSALGPVLGLFVQAMALLVRFYLAIPLAAVCYHQTHNPAAGLILLPWLGFVLHWASIKFDKVDSLGGDANPASRTIRGDARLFKSLYQTPDERYPGDITIKTIQEWMRHGRWFSSYLWGGERNVLMGLARMLGHKTSGYIPEEGMWYRRDDVWRLSFDLGVLKIVVGWQVVMDLDKQHWAVPLFTVKRP